MSGDDPSPAPFEEQAALAELERLQREIEESRRRRRQANDAFDSFIRSFGTRSSAPAPPEPPAAPPLRTDPVPEPQEPPRVQHPVELPKPVETRISEFVGLDEFPREEFAAAEVVPEPGSESSVFEEIVPAPVEPMVRGAARSSWVPLPPSRHVPAALKPASRDQQRRRGLFAVAGVALVAVAVFAWRATHSTQSNDLPLASATGAKPAPIVPPAPAPTSAPAPAPVPAAELTTSRRVWVRVLVDGERTIERELDANIRIPLNAKQRIVLRAGDAGAVRLLLAGKDQGILGPDGIAVTRAFVISPAPPH